LDTLDIVNVAPGTGGSDWMSHVRCRHFRVIEHAHLQNTEFVQGCAEHFEGKFGTSEWISINEAPQAVATCFRFPFSAPGLYTPYPTDVTYVPRHGSNIQPFPIDENLPKRNIVLVGHEIRSDIDYLRSIGYDVSNLSSVLEALDTVDLYRSLKHEQNPTSLGKILLDFGIAGWNLHNAVSDNVEQ